jgi:hypothetical protein
MSEEKEVRYFLGLGERDGKQTITLKHPPGNIMPEHVSHYFSEEDFIEAWNRIPKHASIYCSSSIDYPEDIEEGKTRDQWIVDICNQLNSEGL